MRVIHQLTHMHNTESVQSAVAVNIVRPAAVQNIAGLAGRQVLLTQHYMRSYLRRF